MTTKQEAKQDILVIRSAVKALKKSTSRRMLLANLKYINDYFVDHPAQDLPEHLQKSKP